MSRNISRRSLAKGAAWATPVIATSAVVPAYAASSNTSCTWETLNANNNGLYCPTEADLNEGYFDSNLWGLTSDGTYSTTGGRSIRATTTSNVGFSYTELAKSIGCEPYSGSVTIKVHNASGESYIEAPTLTLADGTVYSGTATLGNTGSGGAKAGFRSSIAIRWEDSAGSANDTSNWEGAVVKVPYEFSYTAPDGTVKTGMMYFSYTMSRYSGVTTAFTDISTTSTEVPPTTACVAS